MKLLHKLINAACNLEAFEKKVGKICVDSNPVIKRRLEGTSGGHLVQRFLLKQGNLDPVAQDHVQLTFGCLQG